MPAGVLIEAESNGVLAKSAKNRGSTPMDFLLKAITIGVPKAGELIEGTFIKRDGPRIFVDLGPYGTGVVYVSELAESKIKIKSFRAGDPMNAKVISLENEEGFIELSLTAAGRDSVWYEAEELMASKKTLNLKITDANKGGLVMEWNGVQGFLPAKGLGKGESVGLCPKVVETCKLPVPPGKQGLENDSGNSPIV